ncbi:MAG TPA: hypothetical protein VGE98_06375 [Thermoanaerobaculia bacterium]
MISNRLSRLLLGVAPLVLVVAAAAPLAAEPSCKLEPKKLTICNVPYALCDKATCKPGPAGTSVECTCPVLNGPSIGSLEQLGGSCTPKQPGQVFSLFSLVGFDPSQQLACPAGSHFAQCWNATCKLLPGGKQATCLCPLCPGPFVTPGGSCNPANCKSEIMVGAAFPIQGPGCK